MTGTSTRSTRTLAVTQNITLDGSVEMIDDWFDGPAQADQSDLLRFNQQQREQADALLCGRRTFTDLRGFWPHQTDDRTGVTDYLNHVSKFVVSSTMTDPEWQNSTVLSGDPVAEVAALKEQPGQDIVVTGSISLTHTLAQAGLVDEYRLFVYPVVQGRGRRLFPDGYRTDDLRVVESVAFLAGTGFLRYAR